MLEEFPRWATAHKVLTPLQGMRRCMYSIHVFRQNMMNHGLEMDCCGRAIEVVD
jgi:hypothetical protein